tara:strand:- start:937 stop:1749 length:813 start_codon:yes stop_codon:yes gene_type:complete
MKAIKNVIYTKKDFKNVIVPSWQRWRNQKNVKDLAEAVSSQGQMRDVLICVTSDGTKILTDGAHLTDAIFKTLKLKKISVKEIYVKNEKEARESFISFNTRGKSLKKIDYIVSFAGSNNADYKRFLTEVMKSPSNMNEANIVHGKLFTIPSLIEIFLGSGNNVKLGKSKLPINFERVLDLVEYLGYNYLNNGKIVKHLKRNGSSMKLNGGSIIPVIGRIKNNKIILQKTNAEILEMLIDFTTYHFNSTESCSFTKDSVGKSFSTYIQDNL